MLTIYQKSIYLIILNATMILRSVGKTIGHNDNHAGILREFKINLFNKIEHLVNCIESNQFNEDVLLISIIDLANQFSISIGQSQKAINVIMKYHYHLNNVNNDEVKMHLHCPIDKKTLNQLGINNLRLNSIDLVRYNSLQNRIGELAHFRVDFDDHWDIQHLASEGFL